MRLVQIAGVIVVGLMLTACGRGIKTPISTAFDNLTSESISARTMFLHEGSFVSISGLAPVHAPGMFFHQPPHVTPGHTIGISPKWSFITTATYPMKSDNDSKTKFGKIVRVYKDVQTQAMIVAERAALRDLMLDVFSKAKGESDDDKKKTLLNRIGQALGLTCPDGCTEGVVEAAILKTAKDVIEKERELREEKVELEDMLTIENVILTRWTARRDQSAEVKEGSGIASITGGAGSAGSGVMLLGGLKITTLYLGEDFLDVMNLWRKGLTRKLLFAQVGIVTYMVQAKYVRYFSDAQLAAQLAAQVKVRLSEFQDLASIVSLVRDAEISAKYLQAAVADLGNSGALGSPIINSRRYCFFPPTEHQRVIDEWIKVEEGGREPESTTKQGNKESEHGYATIFAVTAQIRGLVALLSKRITSTDLERKVAATHPSGDGGPDSDQVRIETANEMEGYCTTNSKSDARKATVDRQRDEAEMK